MPSAPTKIERIRIEKGLTRSQVAERLEMSERQIFRLERGVTPIRKVHLLALAEVLGVDPSELLEDAA